MKKVYLETFGCQMNVSDSERVATLLETKGFEITSNEKFADVILFNTCSVREKAEHKLYTRVGQVSNSTEKKPIVGVMGCVAQLEGETLFQQNRGIDFILGTKAIGRTDEAINEVFRKGKKVIDLGEREENYDWSVSESQRQTQHIAFVPIIEGCNKFCTYCIVPFSRGREKSLLASDIIREVLELKSKGIKEIHLIGQNVNSYRPKLESGLELFKGATPFSRLLRAVAATGMDRIKFTTSFPRDFHPDIVKAIDEHQNLCNWVHLPVQSGSNRILKAMRRGHTIESYLQRIDIIKNSPRNISLTTDIIIGFPGETLEDFEATKQLVEYCQYDSAYTFRYSIRKGTPSAEMKDDVTFEEKTRRFLELEKIQKSIQDNILAGYVNKSVEVLVERKNLKYENQFTGHTTCHKVVNFQGNPDLLGKIINVRITENKSNTLYGVVL
ncbi:MAG TPA: tRNA (N6-isopentenyl adenosine(37)-C2)-methylthiotransferase MiaB [Pyrinomonadaceae bacterium]|nr:tRNA (N6-isopentenyl adenosine(37)-C2)-methylthiotransferase MiaB [Pyrinomonadaceae bacterium]